MICAGLGGESELPLEICHMWEKEQIMVSKWQSRYEIQMPQGMHFTDAMPGSILSGISKASGLEITAWNREGEINSDSGYQRYERGLSPYCCNHPEREQ